MHLLFFSAVEKILQRDTSHIDDLMQGEFSALHISTTNDHVECARLLIAEVSIYSHNFFIFLPSTAFTDSWGKR